MYRLLERLASTSTERAYPRLLAGCVSFGIAENEPDVFAELNGGLVFSPCERAQNGAEVHGRVNDLQVVLRQAEERMGSEKSERQVKS